MKTRREADYGRQQEELEHSEGERRERINCLGGLGIPEQVEMDTEWEIEGSTRKESGDIDGFLNMAGLRHPQPLPLFGI